MQAKLREDGTPVLSRMGKGEYRTSDGRWEIFRVEPASGPDYWVVNSWHPQDDGMLMDFGLLQTCFPTQKAAAEALGAMLGTMSRPGGTDDAEEHSLIKHLQPLHRVPGGWTSEVGGISVVRAWGGWQVRLDREEEGDFHLIEYRVFSTRREALLAAARNQGIEA